MQVFGKTEFAYNQGTCAIFPSDAVHKSGSAETGTIKIALFFARRESHDVCVHSELACICGDGSLNGAMVQCDICALDGVTSNAPDSRYMRRR